MACPPGNCASWAAFRLCKLLPPVCLGCDYDPGELQMLWFCWRARSTGEYQGLTPVDLAPGLIDISGKTNISKIIEYCNSRGTLVAPFTEFSRFGLKWNLFNYKVSGALTGFGNAPGDRGEDPIAPPAGGGSGGGGGGLCPCTPDGGVDLTVVVCTELDCDADEPKIEITVCGGTPPYQWSIAGHEGVVTITQSGSNNRNVEVTPPEQTTVGGIAYWRGYEAVRAPSSCVNSDGQWAEPFGCEDQSLGVCRQTAFGQVFDIKCEFLGQQCGILDCVPDRCDGTFSLTGLHDVRSQQMIDDGCIPCQAAMQGATITVEDADGTTVVTTISL